MNEEEQHIELNNSEVPANEHQRQRGQWLTMCLAMVVVFLVGIGVAIIVTNQKDSTSDGSVRPLRTWKAADFTLESLDGQTVALSDYVGRPVFLNFWATWCAPCRREFPAFARFMSEQTGAGPIVLTINQGDTNEQVQEFLDSLEIDDITVLMDRDFDLPDLYPSNKLPTTYVVDAAGFVRYTKYGEVTYDDLYAYLAELESGVGG